MSNKELGEYLKNIREKLGYSTHEISRLCDISQSFISLMENGKRKASPIILKKLSDIYFLDYIDLLEKAEYYDLVQLVNIDKNIQGMNKKSEGSAVVLIYGSIPAGTPMECIEDIIDTEEIPADMLKGGKQYFGLKVKGDSMNPEYLDGDTLILLKQDDCESGDDCVVMVNGNSGTFKRVIKNEEKQTIRLQPLNTTLDEDGNFLYEPITFTKEQIEQLPVRILGVVEEIRRKKRRK